ncbi:MAG: putative molybdenum carrier protein [Mariprofundus sp.]|nr:putative molybdenum carrier protein [Mariprofundus sp.]
MKKVISGGQTGVDRAALDAAMAQHIETGGWCPRGRRALDGEIPPHYPLLETQGKGYQTRTKWNVRDSDATLILCHGEPSGGTALTVRYCQALAKPYFICRLHAGRNPVQMDDSLLPWLSKQRVMILNVAGPRENKAYPIYRPAYELLELLFKQWQQLPPHRHGPLFSASLNMEGEVDT